MSKSILSVGASLGGLCVLSVLSAQAQETILQPDPIIPQTQSVSSSSNSNILQQGSGQQGSWFSPVQATSEIEGLSSRVSTGIGYKKEFRPNGKTASTLYQPIEYLVPLLEQPNHLLLLGVSAQISDYNSSRVKVSLGSSLGLLWRYSFAPESYFETNAFYDFFDFNKSDRAVQQAGVGLAIKSKHLFLGANGYKITSERAKHQNWKALSGFDTEVGVGKTWTQTNAVSTWAYLGYHRAFPSRAEGIKGWSFDTNISATPEVSWLPQNTQVFFNAGVWKDQDRKAEPRFSLGLEWSLNPEKGTSSRLSPVRRRKAAFFGKREF